MSCLLPQQCCLCLGTAGLRFISRDTEWTLRARAGGNYQSPQLVFRLNVDYFSPLIFYFFYKVIYFMYLLLAALGLCCCAQAFSSCGERELLFVAVHGLLTMVASLVVEHGL